MPRALWWSWRGLQFLMNEVPLYQLEVNVNNDLEVKNTTFDFPHEPRPLSPKLGTLNPWR